MCGVCVLTPVPSGRPPVPEPPASKEDLVGSFIGLQSTLSAQEPLLVKALAAYPKDAARFSRSVRAAAAAQGASDPRR